MYLDPVFVAKQKIHNRFLLSVAAFERAKQLIRGAKPRTEKRFHSHVTTALEEIAEERVVPAGDGNFKLA